jgi:asparagine synthase (glutamine-hydrolysing)
MTRLKVVDQSDLFVPFDFRDHLGVALAFNGEIYNWRQLRSELSGPWETQCDAEVVAALWREHGPAALDKMNGMWGLVLVDTWADAVFVARDRAGEKPLYWSQLGPETVYLASEAKALPGALQECPCDDWKALEFDCGAETPLCDVHAMPPGSCALIGNPGPLGSRFEQEVASWWQLPYEDEDCHWTDEEVEALVVDAIRIRYVSERPIAVQLSGGLDSAIIQAVVEADRLYCVTFGADLDNLPAARLAAGGCDVVPVTFTLDELFAALPSVAYHLDTPGTWSAICQWFMNRRIAKDGGVVVMSGEGADELWGGYARYRILRYFDCMFDDEHLVDYRPLMARTLAGADATASARMLNRAGPEMLPHSQRLVEKYGGDGSLVSRMARTDFYTTMQVLLRMADRMTAAFGLEGRSPFLDYRLMELAARIPARQKVASQSKLPLRTVAARLGVPAGIGNERTKRGLTVPPNWGQKLNSGVPLWDRKWFSRRMHAEWRGACLRPPLCTLCAEH